ncbi:hypothetical protein BJ165DRAFT_1458770 [Panaeolus papilionaceus]|nr:hypothetical protein BJ165DRAFT_1458770 [Panaeolus papilionaceus]
MLKFVFVTYAHLLHFGSTISRFTRESYIVKPYVISSTHFKASTHLSTLPWLAAAVSGPAGRSNVIPEIHILTLTSALAYQFNQRECIYRMSKPESD